MSAIRSMRAVVVFAAPLLMLGAAAVHAQSALPTITMQQGQLVTPTNAVTFYGAGTTHTYSVPSVQTDAGAGVRRLEIKELARGLGAALIAGGQLTQAAYADRVYEYVSQNIAVDFMYGLQKGAFGALLDQRGTPFDQAQLMVELLREGGVTANYQIGTITITDFAAFSNWTGAPDALSACRLLADGGIPATVNGSTAATCSVSGTITALTMRHIWVSAASKLYDPSYKLQTWKAGIDVAAAMSCGTAAAPTCYTTLKTALTANPTPSGSVYFLQNLTKTAFDNQLKTFATNLQTTLQSTYPNALLDDIVGGKGVGLPSIVSPSATLPYTTATTTTWTGDIPDQYRTTVQVQYDSINKTLFVDEIYGKRTHLKAFLSNQSADAQSATRRVSLYVEYELLAVSTRAGGTVDNSVLTMIVNHPYASNSGTYMDQTVANVVGQTRLVHDGGIGGVEVYFSPTSLVHGWGGAGAGMIAHFTAHKEYSDSILPLKDPLSLTHNWDCTAMMPWSGIDIEPWIFSFTTPPGSTIGEQMWPTCNAHSQPLLTSNWLVQNSAALGLIARVNSSVIDQHHTIGSITSDRLGSAFNISSAVSVTSLRNDPIDRKAAAFSLSAISSHLEANVIQQGDDGWETWSAVSAWVRANELARQFVLVPTAASLAQAGLSGYSSSELARINSYLSSGHALALPKQAVIYSWNQLHGDRSVRDSVVAFKSTGDSIAHVLAGTKGARTSSLADPTASVYDSVKQPNKQLNPRQYHGVDQSTGALSLSPPPDITTGAGGFPASLSFQRVFNSAGSGQPCMTVDCERRNGLQAGWDFTLNAIATMGTDTLQALGQDSALDATASIATLFALRDASRGVVDAASGFAPAMVSAFTAYWWGSGLINNSVFVKRPPSTAVFIRLPNGNFNSPPDSAEQLVQTGSRTALTPAAVLDQTYYTYSPVSFAVTDKSGSVLTFKTPRSLANPPPPGALDEAERTFLVQRWTFPSGIIIDYDYVFAGTPPFGEVSRTAIRNNLGRRLQFALGPEAGETTVSDDNGRSIRYAVFAGSSAFTTTDNKATQFTYAITGTFSAPRITYSLDAWYSPADPTVPLVQFQYDTVGRVSSVSIAANNAAGTRSVTSYLTSGLGMSESIRRGEIRDQLNAVTTTYLGKFGEELQTIDPLGRITTKTYDTRQRLKRVISPEAHVTAAGVPRTPAGDWVEYSYDQRHNVTQTRKKAKEGSARPDIVTSSTYPATCTSANSCNKPSSTTDALGRITSYAYYTDGQIRQIVGPTLAGGGGNARTDFCYTLLGPAGSQFRLAGGRIEVVGAGKPNRVTSFSYNSSNKYVLSNVVADPSTTLIAATNDTTACTTSSKSGALGFTTAFTFDNAGNVRTINGPRPDSPVADLTTYTFDTERRLRQVDGPSGTGVQTVYDYYDDGALKSIDRQGVRQETRAYWPSRDLLTVTNAESNVTRYDYDLAGRATVVTDPDSRRVGTVYDLAGQTLCTWKGWNSATGPNSCVWDPATYISAGNNGPLRYAAYEYTLNGKQRTIADAKNSTTEYVYDNHDYLRYTFFPNGSDGSRCVLPAALPGGVETGTPTCTAAGGTTPRYEDLWHTVDGTAGGALCSADVGVCRKRNRANQNITFTYDEMARLKTKAAAGRPTVTYTYNLLDQPLTATAPVSGSIPAHGVRYDYDDAGRKSFEENLINGAYRRVTYGYNEAGNRTSTLWPDGYLVGYVYDVLNRMTEVWDTNSAFKLAGYTYDAFSRRQSLRFASTATNEATYAYEPDSQLDVLTHTLSGTQGFNLNYNHNGSGQITSIVASDDAFLPMPAAPPTPYASNRLNQYGTVAGQNSTYDANGNLATWFPSGGKHTYTYDSENRLTSAAINGSATATIFYDYDALGRRLSKRDDNTNTRTGYLLEGDEEIAEYNIDPATGTWATTALRRYVTGPAADDRVAAIDVTGGRTYYHVNHQGSVLAMTDASGDSLICAGCQRLAYDEYGQLGVPNPTGQPYRYTGRRLDGETGLYYYRARYYAPALGRFLQTDPVGYDTDLNLYGYVSNDPLNRNDPSGLAGVPCGGSGPCIDAMFSGPKNIPSLSPFVVNYAAGIGDVLLSTVSLTLVDGNEIRTIIFDDLGGVDTESEDYTAGIASAIVGTMGLGRVFAPTKPNVAYTRADYRVNSNSPAARAARSAGEGQPCPKCGTTMVSGTAHAPWAQHEPTLTRYHYNYGGWSLSSAAKQEYANSSAAYNGANCALCQRREGVIEREFARMINEELGLN